MRKRTVADLMNPNVICVRPDMTVREAEQLFASRGVSGAPVVDAGGRLVGVISQNDLIRYLAVTVTVEESGRFVTDVEDYSDLSQFADTRSDTPIEKLMTRKVYTVTHDTGVAVAANIMRERRIHRLMVMNSGALAGIISSLDLLRVVEESG